MSYKHFLPYQIRWLNDNSKIKIWEKSRRIGATYVQSFEDVQDCLNKKVPAVWFSSADESAAKEYIDYCEMWVRYFHAIAKNKGVEVIDNDKDIKALVIEFKNGTKIHALSSNPKGFRSKGGKVVLDEFAFHNNPEELWKAARPCVTWGYPLRILSTHNGQNCLYYKFIEQVNKGQLNWSLHKTPIQVAVSEGLVDKIYQRQTSKEEQEAWMQNEKDNCFDEYTWLQEYCCIAVDEACAFLPYELISTCEMDDVLKPLSELQHDFYVGVDIGRKKDLTVIWVLEKLENIKESTSCSTIKEDPCFVYLMHDEANGFYKIGMSNNPIYREGTLQSEKPTIKLIASHKYPSRKFASALEAALHNLYSNLHVRGEWYRLRDEDVNEIIEGLK